MNPHRGFTRCGRRLRRLGGGSRGGLHSVTNLAIRRNAREKVPARGGRQRVSGLAAVGESDKSQWPWVELVDPKSGTGRTEPGCQHRRVHRYEIPDQAPVPDPAPLRVEVDHAIILREQADLLTLLRVLPDLGGRGGAQTSLVKAWNVTLAKRAGLTG